jgi:hypothetical protein
MHPIDNRRPTSPYGLIRFRDGRVEEGRAALAVTVSPDGRTEIVKKMKLAKGMAKLALPLLASGSIELPARPLDVPPRRARYRTQKK